MKFEIGDTIQDLNGNIYEIVDSENTSNHFNKPNRFQVDCVEGPNEGKTERWVNVDTMNSMTLKKLN